MDNTSTSFLNDFKETPKELFLKSLDKQFITVCGYEGCLKSRMLLEVALEKYCGVTIYACKSFSMLKDKQREIMSTYSLSATQVPIVALKYNELYKQYYTTPNAVFRIPNEAKVILMTQSALQQNLMQFILDRNHPRRIVIDGALTYSKPIVKMIILDEFEPSIGIIPSLQFTHSNFLKNVNESNERDWNKTKFIKFLENEYSKQDVLKMKALSEQSNFNTPFVANWIERLRTTDIKLVVATSETLAVKLLGSIGFSTCELDYTSDFSNHTVDIAFDKLITKPFINKLNAEYAWGHFGFNTIISDSYRDLTNEVVEVECPSDCWYDKLITPKPKEQLIVNHTEARGSNKIAGRGKLLTIMTLIPTSTIESFKECINYFCKASFTFDEIKKTFYRDRLMQAVGRVIGHRGVWKDNFQTNVLCNEDIGKCLFDFNKEDKTIVVKDEDLKIPYTFKMWDFNSPKILEVLERVASDKRIEVEKRLENTTNTANKRNLLNQANFSVLCNHFKKDSSETRIDYEDFRVVLDKLCLTSASSKPLQVAVAVKMFGGDVKTSSVRIDGKVRPFRYIVGVSYKEASK